MSSAELGPATRLTARATPPRVTARRARARPSAERRAPVATVGVGRYGDFDLATFDAYNDVWMSTYTLYSDFDYADFSNANFYAYWGGISFGYAELECARPCSPHAPPPRTLPLEHRMSDLVACPTYPLCTRAAAPPTLTMPSSSRTETSTSPSPAPTVRPSTLPQ